MAHPVAVGAARRYANRAKARFGDRVVGLYLIGSGALGGFDPRRSDVDILVVLEGRDADDCDRIRRIQLASGARTALGAMRRGRAPGVGTCNAAYVEAAQLSRPVTEIDPIGSHVGHELACGTAFDVNPVQWRTLIDHGVAVVGAAPSELALDPEPDALAAWNHRNLHDYWLPLAHRTGQGRRPLPIHSLRTGLHWTVLGPLRLHATITTGAIVSKHGAGEHGIRVAENRWHPLIRAAQRALAGERPPRDWPKAELLADMGTFAAWVVADADRVLGGAPAP